MADIAAAGDCARFMATDVGDAGQNRRLMDEAVARHGRIDIVCSNAGDQEPRTLLLADAAEDAFDRVLDTSVRSVMAS